MMAMCRSLEFVRGLVGAGLAVALSGGAMASGPKALPAFNIDIAQTSISGISSGGFMAAQFQVAHSSIVKGAGIVAAGPYYCAQGNVVTATTKCSCTLDAAHAICDVSSTSADVSGLTAAARRFAQAGLIDDLSNLARQRVVTFAGGKDQTVPSSVVRQLDEFYLAAGVPTQNLRSEVIDGAGHTMPTTSYGNACDVSAEPYIDRCGVDAAGKILGGIYDGLKAPTPGRLKGRFVEFDQRPYVQAATADYLWGAGMDVSGWLYVPRACKAGAKCRLHVALHGCKQGQSYQLLQPQRGDGRYGTTFVRNAGYARWADSNNIVVLFPQAVSIPYLNPNGCWDWWGYTDGHYADRRGVQITALRAMVDRLAAGAR